MQTPADRPAPETAERLERLNRLANIMDSLFRVPGTSINVGLDSIVGLIPGIGDTLALLPAGYIIASAAHMGVPRRTLLRMGLNTGVDTLIGSIPLIGDLFDIGWKGNRRNVALLRKHLEGEGALAEAPATRDVEDRMASPRPVPDRPVEMPPNAPRLY